MKQRGSKRKFRTVNPATEEIIGEYSVAGKKEVGLAVSAARKAFDGWKQRSFSEKAEHMLSLAAELRKRKSELGETITREMGKPIKEAVPEVEKCAWALEYYAENGQKFLEDELARTDALKSYVVFEPLGVVASIMPWNFPVWQAMRFAGPALLVGNTIVFKPSSVCPQSGLELERIFHEAGFPSGCFNTIIGNADTAQAMIESDIDAVSFTGSVQAGAKVAEAAAKRVKKFVLELGGSDPFIVLEDADLDAASDGAVRGRFVNCGQSCIAAKRFLVVKGVAEQFLDRFVKKTEQLKVGDPMGEDTDIGPLVSEGALKNIEGQVKDAVRKGATVTTGGNRIGTRGYFYAPTILTDVTKEMRVMREETFGPVAPVMIVEDWREAVREANDTEFGLGATVWTGDLGRGEKITRQINVGLVTVNKVLVSDPRVPFGGVKSSGIGRELSRYGLLEFTNIKTIRVYNT